MDGGSTDESPAIIQAYAKQHPGTVSWVSEPDHGQADAINKGMKQASGEILAYLNSDDTYAPGAIATVVAFLKEHPEVHLVHGRGLHINPDGATINTYPSLPCDHKALSENCHICQPTAFWRREVSDTIGAFDASLRYALDYDYWIRASQHFTIAYLDIHLANTRLHGDAKTVQQRYTMHQEIARLVKAHYGVVSDHWIYSLAHSIPAIDRLRTGKLLDSLIYVPAFILAACWLFLKYNHKIPRRTVARFFQSLPQFRKAGRLSGATDHP